MNVAFAIVMNFDGWWCCGGGRGGRGGGGRLIYTPSFSLSA
jgi:hypothetical protein